MAATPADVMEYPNSYVFVIDMPGLKSGDIKVQVEDDNVLTISGERKRGEEKKEAKYVRMDRRVGKFMEKFVLSKNANTDSISAVCQDGVLTVTVEKLPPPEPKKPKKPKTVEVNIVKEYPNSYVFVIDMPGLKSGDIKVQVEFDNVPSLLTISGGRKRGGENKGPKYERMERRVGKFMRKFVLPENANTDSISAVCQDGVLTVTVEKLPPPEPKKPKTIEVKIA